MKVMPREELAAAESQNDGDVTNEVNAKERMSVGAQLSRGR